MSHGSPFHEHHDGPSLDAGLPQVPAEFWPDRLGTMLPGEIVFAPIDFAVIDSRTKALYINADAGLDPLAADPQRVTGERIAVMRVMGETFGGEAGQDYYIVDISGLHKGEIPEHDVSALATEEGHMLRPADVLVVSDGLEGRTVDYRLSSALQPFADRIRPIARDVSTATIARLMLDLEDAVTALGGEEAEPTPDEAEPMRVSRVADAAGRCIIRSDVVLHPHVGRTQRRKPTGAW